MKLSQYLMFGAVVFNMNSMIGSGEATTEAMKKAIQKEVIKQCAPISDNDEITLASEKITEQWSHQPEGYIPATGCDLDTPGCRGTTFAVGTADNFRTSEMVLLRTDSKKKYSYTIQLETEWDQDLPIPQPGALIKQSEYCKWKPPVY